MIPAPLADAPGHHVCAVADRDGARAELAAAWTRAGLRAGERVMWLSADTAPPLDWLSAHGVGWQDALARGQLSVLPVSDLLTLRSVADIPACLARAGELVDAALASGYAGLRVGAVTADALEAMPGIPAQLELEAAWEEYVPGRALSLLCLYDPAVHAQYLPHAVALHRHALADGMAVVATDVATLRLSGEVDLSNAHLLDALLARAIRDDLTLELGALEFIDVRGVARLVALSRELRPERRLRLASPPRLLDKILTVAGWTDEFQRAGGDE